MSMLKHTGRNATGVKPIILNALSAILVIRMILMKGKTGFDLIFNDPKIYMSYYREKEIISSTFLFSFNR